MTSGMDPLEFDTFVNAMRCKTIEDVPSTNRATVIRHVIGLPTKKVRANDPEQRLFKKMIDRIVEARCPYVLTISGYPFLMETCPGGIRYLIERDFKFNGNPSSLFVHDFSAAWNYHNLQDNCMIRSVQHLYDTIERELARLSAIGQLNREIFLLTSGDPNVSNALVELWKIKHLGRTVIYPARSPIEAAGDFVEEQFNHTGIPLRRYYFSGTEVIRTSLEELRKKKGLIILISIDDAYKRSNRDPSIVARIFQTLSHAFDPQTRVYAIYVGYEKDIVFESKIAEITFDLHTQKMRSNQQYTFVIYNA